GCPYNCDPKWPDEWKCPSCQGEDEPEIEIISGIQRYSRIQGNEYTNEAKILGVKDIQAIVQGESPTDPRAFIGTGVLRGNRGVVCVDELPAIPTKVQVLFHPILQEGKIVLEEYNWVRPIDIFFVATGNPTGFSHVNRVPEPLLDRLELIPMALPEEDIEREIMLKEGFRVREEFFLDRKKMTTEEPIYVKPDELRRRASAPWWIVDTVEKTVRYTRDCPNIDRGSSIRGSIKSLDHTLSSTERSGRRVAGLREASDGLKLALRSRIRLRADLVGFDDSPAAFMVKNDEVVEDVFWYAARDVGLAVLKGVDVDQKQLAGEINAALSGGGLFNNLQDHEAAYRVVRFMEENQPWESPSLVSGLGDLIRDSPEAVDPEILHDYRGSALELLAHALTAGKVVEIKNENAYTPRRME
ncbi:MAG: AAA family ATPase, partial [Candidatus Bathyarchaeota archaeon]|nr:AAA family ATPase [Candidatus Bathyarchaeota archaeon]